MMILGCNVTLSTFLPTALGSMYGIDMAMRGTIASMVTLGNCIGSIAGPIVYSKIKKIKIFVPLIAVLIPTYILTPIAGDDYGMLFTTRLDREVLNESIVL